MYLLYINERGLAAPAHTKQTTTWRHSALAASARPVATAHMGRQQEMQMDVFLNFLAMQPIKKSTYTARSEASSVSVLPCCCFYSHNEWTPQNLGLDSVDQP